jgi:hypothetical protein
LSLAGSSVIDIIELTGNCGKKQQLMAQPKSNKTNQEKGGDGRQQAIRQYSTLHRNSQKRDGVGDGAR